MIPRALTLADLDYVLPPERIAQEPIRPRDAARLLVLERQSGSLAELCFRDLPDHVGPEDLLIVNDTRVRRAKLRGHKASGGRAEVLLLEQRDDGSWLALLKSTGRQRPGLRLRFGELEARIEALLPHGVCVLRIESDSDTALEQSLERLGEAPLPPYIRRSKPRPQDLQDYQTIFARVPGALAAPTASLHFTAELARRLRIETVTLHVGPATFRPLCSEPLDDLELEPEAFEVPARTARAVAHARARGGRVIAVGTTVVRALESTGGEPGQGRTDLLVRPGHVFGVVDSLITNFHLPRSSLLLLVMAFAGTRAIREAYAHALAKGFRFYSYGDAMWIR